MFLQLFYLYADPVIHTRKKKHGYKQKRKALPSNTVCDAKKIQASVDVSCLNKGCQM